MVRLGLALLVAALALRLPLPLAAAPLLVTAGHRLHLALPTVIRVRVRVGLRVGVRVRARVRVRGGALGLCGLRRGHGAARDEGRGGHAEVVLGLG